MSISYAVFCLKNTSATEIYTLSLHDALPIAASVPASSTPVGPPPTTTKFRGSSLSPLRSEEHTSELQSHVNLVCRLLLEKYFGHRDLHPFPTRRSSDRGQCAR